jgi:CubicO group peptidase (beta-lactamase class C family)
MRSLLILLLLPTFVFGQGNYQEQLDSLMQMEVKVNNFNGNVLVAKSGNIIYQKSFGYRDYNSKELLNNNSIFELGSISKQFTAMGILLLREKGKLQLSDSLRKFFPELPYHNITIKQMLTHTSGLPDYDDESMSKTWDHKKVAFNNDMIKILADKKPRILFQPGEKWEYSNTGYAILASIIEKVSGQSFKDYMQENIFNPLGMEHSRIYNTRYSTKEIISNYAYGFTFSDRLKRYILPDSLPEKYYVYCLDGIVGARGVNSTTADLLKWARALKDHTLLSETSQVEMLSKQFVGNPTWKINDGYGVSIDENKFGNYFAGAGRWPGYETRMIHYTGNDITIIVLSNNESDREWISTELAYVVNEKPISTSKEFLLRNKKWKDLAELIDKEIKTGEINNNEVHRYCWGIYEDCNENAIITKAIIWMKNVTEDESSHDCLPNYLDTYACLLLKNGDKKMARKVREEIAKRKS